MLDVDKNQPVEEEVAGERHQVLDAPTLFLKADLVNAAHRAVPRVGCAYRLISFALTNTFSPLP